MSEQEEIYQMPQFRCENCNWVGTLKACLEKEISTDTLEYTCPKCNGHIITAQKAQI